MVIHTLYAARAPAAVVTCGWFHTPARVTVSQAFKGSIQVLWDCRRGVHICVMTIVATTTLASVSFPTGGDGKFRCQGDEIRVIARFTSLGPDAHKG